MNNFTYRGSMLWGDFAAFLRRNAGLNVQLKFERQADRALPEVCTIMDYNRPYRLGKAKLQASKYGEYTDWAADSQVVNAAWLNGEIPMHAPEGKTCRGARTVVEVMVNDGALRRTPEVEEFLDGTQRRV